MYRPWATALADGRFYRNEVWQGLTVHVPGRGDSTVLGLESSVPVPTTGGPYKLTTRNRDVFSCISMKSGLPGEGFRMTTTDGVSYDFNVAVTRTASKLVKLVLINADGSKYEPFYLERTHYYLLASTITDRYGNAVNYQYGSDGHPTDISATDGRDIALTYSDHRLQSATSESHTWSYAYWPADHTLKSVTCLTTASGNMPIRAHSNHQPPHRLRACRIPGATVHRPRLISLSHSPPPTRGAPRPPSSSTTRDSAAAACTPANANSTGKD